VGILLTGGVWSRDVTDFPPKKTCETPGCPSVVTAKEG